MRCSVLRIRRKAGEEAKVVGDGAESGLSARVVR